LVIQDEPVLKRAQEGSRLFPHGAAHHQIASALVNLGFRPMDVDKVIAQMPQDIDLQDGIRQGLTALGTV
jgi:Holliday junction resolvasome RuvABC DNA-binding subunit